MVKYTQTIRLQQPTNCLNVFDHFVGLALKGFNFNVSDILQKSQSFWKFIIIIIIIIIIHLAAPRPTLCHWQ